MSKSLQSNRAGFWALCLVGLRLLSGTLVACSDDDDAAPPVVGEAGQGGSAGSGGSMSIGARAGSGGSQAPSGGGEGGAPAPVGGSGGDGMGGEAAGAAGDGPVGEAGAAGEAGSGGEAGAGGADGGLRDFVLDSGHIDLFEITYEAGQLVTRVKDDTQLYSLMVEYREPEVMSVSVDTQPTATVIPEGLPPEYAFLGTPGQAVYILDQNQQEGLPWPGWSTERLASTLPPELTIPDTLGAVKLTIEVTGPGEIFSYMIDAVGLPINRYIDTTDNVPDVIPMTPHAHVHTAWAFTQPGDYHLKTTPSAVTSSNTMLTGPTHEYHFYVGPPKLPSFEAPLLTINNVQASYAVGAPVVLTVAQDPPTAWSSYRWYRWDEGKYVEIPGLSTASVSFAASTSAQYGAALLGGANGRIVATAFADVVVNP